jgi:hypothetical protein
VASAAVIDPNLFNATTNGSGDDPPGLSTGFVVSSRVAGVDDPEGAFGRNTGPIEPNTFIFGDGATPDNGNTVMGDGGETVNSLSWQTTQPVLLLGYNASLPSDGPVYGYNRGSELVRFSTNGEVDDFFDDNSAGGGTRLFSIPQLGNSYTFESTNRTGGGARIAEIDAVVQGAFPSGVHVSPTLFNASTNGVGDEPAGLATAFATSPAIPGSNVEAAFGSNHGGIEGNSFLFADGGTVDNHNNTFDPGAETIDYITWQTQRPLELFGYELSLIGDNATLGAFRSTQLVRFYVDGVLRDTMDFNAFSATVDRLFDGGPVTGSSFRLEVTRNTLGGPRIGEINAIVPEPGTGLTGAIGAVTTLGALLLRRKTGDRLDC